MEPPLNTLLNMCSET